MAIFAAREALRKYGEYGYSEAMLFFAQDLEIFINEVHRVIGKTRVTRLLRAYLNSYWESGEQERKKIATEFFDDKLPDILEKLEEMSK